jgi:ubiquinone/menaquinone biosynthesis C-methylase UbiE
LSFVNASVKYQIDVRGAVAVLVKFSKETKPMTAPQSRNEDQFAYWNGSAGRHWTERQETQDALLAPVSAILMGQARLAAGENVLDIGCGCGATSLDAARRVGPGGSVLGLDISSPMLARARELAPPGAPIRFVEADATVHSFEPGQADVLLSRFGVMFFADPALSFANMRRALRKGGRVVFACWREPRLNPWMIAPLQEAYKFAPRLPEMVPEDPGPFAFASEDRVRRILLEAGFDGIALTPFDVTLDVAVGKGLENAVVAALEIGPASRALENQPPDVRAAATQAIRSMLAARQRGQSVPMAGAIWIVRGLNP